MQTVVGFGIADAVTRVILNRGDFLLSNLTQPFPIESLGLGLIESSELLESHCDRVEKVCHF